LYPGTLRGSEAIRPRLTLSLTPARGGPGSLPAAPVVAADGSWNRPEIGSVELHMGGLPAGDTDDQGFICDPVGFVGILPAVEGAGEVQTAGLVLVLQGILVEVHHLRARREGAGHK
jgi:hypothetical protein